MLNYEIYLERKQDFMAKNLNSKTKLCMVKHNGPISALGNVVGPILHPCRINTRAIINMVHQGIQVIEINPKNHKEQVTLTIQNVSLNNFPEAPKYKMPEQEKKEAPVVAKAEDVIPAKQNNIVEPHVEEKNETVEITYPETSENEEKSNGDTVIETSDETSEKKNEKSFYKNDFHKKNKHK